MQYEPRGTTFSLGNSSMWQMDKYYKYVIRFPYLTTKTHESGHSEIEIIHFPLCQVQKCCSTFKVAAVLWRTIQSWVVVQHNPG